MIKRLLALLLAGTMMMSVGAESVFAEEKAEEDASASERAQEDEKDIPRTDADALAEAEKIAENAKLELYLNKDEKTIALVAKDTGYIWWSAPINAKQSEAKAAQLQKLISGLALTYGDPEKRKTSTEQSSKAAKLKYKTIPNGVSITYTFKTPGITVPVNYTLEEDYLKVYVDCSQIVEETPKDSTPKLLTSLKFMGSFGSADMEEEGYFVIPDGSGAVINFNNNKTGYTAYSGRVYGNDLTKVPTTKPVTREQITLPVYGIVKGENALMVVADKGDSVANINALVANQEKRTNYNLCNFSFDLRTDDQYYVGGESNPLTVFETNGICVPELEVRYYPLTGSDLSYIDIADRYRDYLMSDKGVTKRGTADDISFYADFYGGMMKNKSVAGVPVDVKESVTTFSQAKEILEALNGKGIDSIVVDYNEWTNAGIKNNIVDKAKPSSVLGGKNAFNDLMDYAGSTGTKIYPGVNNVTFTGGSGYLTFTNTAIRVSKAYARLVTYDYAYGIENKFYDPLSLLSPAKYEEIYAKLGKSYNENGLTNISLGKATTSIYGDYGRHAYSRETSKQALINSYASLQQNVGSILASNANAYALPYVDHVTDVPLYSSQFDTFDYDIPFVQMVLNGVVSYSSKPINSAADTDEMFLLSLVSGSNIHYDMIYEEASELKDTRYDVYYYATYQHWLDTAAKQYEVSKDVLSQIKGKKMTGYKVTDKENIESQFEDVTVSVDMNAKTVTVNGKIYRLSDGGDK